MIRWRLWPAPALALLLLAGACAQGSSDSSEGSGSTSVVAQDLVLEDAWALPALHVERDRINGGRLVDEGGREVILRGVNVNALVEYWAGNEFETVFELTDDDIDLMAGIGWNAVRLLLSWSRVEPEPGVYDDDYLAEVERTVDRLASRGIYTVLDLHQDAWGLTLAARVDEGCGPGTEPALGWDGAPGWATVGGTELGSRCTIGGSRESSPAVIESFTALFDDLPGPDGVGLRTRYADMLAAVAGRFAARPEVAGIDLMNEPNALTDETLPGLADLYAESTAAIREAEERMPGGLPHSLLVEPSIIWSGTGLGVPPSLPEDENLVYAPHIYTGGFDGGPITEEAFAIAVDDALALGGLPVLAGEWGADPGRAGPDGDGYFVDHQDLQDQTGIGATLWTWRESCGDPHKVGEDDPVPWGAFDVDCSTNEVTGTRDVLVGDLTRGRVRAAPGRLGRTAWDGEGGVLTAEGVDATAGTTLVAFVPADPDVIIVTVDGLEDVRVAATGRGGSYVLADSIADEWSLDVRPAPSPDQDPN